jgi:uncharacterized protein (TIGR02246 family)
VYVRLLTAWNAQDAAGFAALFAVDGGVVGFDGSPMDGRAAIAQELSRIFADHRTGAYVAVVRAVRFVGAEAAVLRAVSGLVPAGQSDLNPATNSLQSLTAELRHGRWEIVHYHNTPAQFHGRPELAQALTEELRQLL